MILLTKATTAEEEDGSNAGDATDKAVVAMLVTVLNGSTMAWPLVRKIITGDYHFYVNLARTLLCRYPVLVYNKVWGVGGWCGPKKPVRKPFHLIPELVFRCFLFNRTRLKTLFMTAV